VITVVHLITGLGGGGAEGMLARLVARSEPARSEPAGSEPARFRHVVVSLTDDGFHGPAIRRAGVPVHCLGMGRGRPSLGGFLRLVWLLRRLRPDIVQTWLYHADLLGLLVGRLTRVPCVVWNLRCSNMDLSRYGWQTRLVLRLLSRLSAWPDAVLTNAESGRRYHQAIGYRARRWELVPNGFDLARFRPDPRARARARAQLGLGDGDVVIGMVARADPMKDHASFVAAAARLRRDRPEARFVLVGRGVADPAGAVAGAVAQAGMSEQFRLLDERADLEQLLPAFDLASLSSAFGEGFANVLGEAMACALPCVATDVGDARQVIGETGLIVPPGDPAALANAWRQMIEAGAERRAALGLAARQRIAERFSLETALRRYQAIYESLVERAPVAR